MTSDIILIGPMGTGKSTLGRLLAEKLNVPQVSMDKLRFDYYKQIGYDEALAQQLRTEHGLAALFRYWEPFHPHAVEKLLAEHSDCVIDFGAGHSVYDDAVLFERVHKILEPYPNVVLILPSPDLDESVQILKERMKEHQGWDGVDDGIDFHEHFVKHHCNHDLAKFVVYTKCKIPEETRDEIISLTR
jgi:ABC-type arginine transport system ATPase subunit